MGKAQLQLQGEQILLDPDLCILSFDLEGKGQQEKESKKHRWLHQDTVNVHTVNTRSFLV